MMCSSHVGPFAAVGVGRAVQLMDLGFQVDVLRGAERACAAVDVAHLTRSRLPTRTSQSSSRHNDLGAAVRHRTRAEQLSSELQEDRTATGALTSTAASGIGDEMDGEQRFDVRVGDDIVSGRSA